MKKYFVKEFPEKWWLTPLFMKKYFVKEFPEKWWLTPLFRKRISRKMVADPIISCSGDTTSSNPVTTAPQTATDGSCSIKGNIGSTGEKIYHMIGCGSYAKTKIDETHGEKMFCSEKEALDAGWRKALNCD